MTSEKAAEYYANEAKKEEIRSLAANDKRISKLHEQRAEKLQKIADNIKKLFCRSYHKATRINNEDHR